MRKLLRHASILGIASALSFPTYAQMAWAASGFPAVKALVNGHPIEAIVVHGSTYVNWGALDLAHTPYQYLGHGTFALTGKTVTGVVYRGTTYLPWPSIAPKVVAIRLPGGGWNFVTPPVPHAYHVALTTKQSRDTLTVQFQTLDGQAGVPHQRIQASCLDPAGNSLIETSLVTDPSGNATWTLQIPLRAQTVAVRWTAPDGSQETATALLEAQNADRAQTSTTVTSVAQGPLPPENVVAQTPIQVQDNAVYFDAQVNGADTTFQLDTGAYEIYIPEDLAISLGLTEQDPVAVGGIGGAVEGYDSVIPSLTIGGVTFHNVPCVIGPTGSVDTPLFGYEFFADNGYDLLISNHDQRLYILAHP
jgi:hypothetical protein